MGDVLEDWTDAKNCTALDPTVISEMEEAGDALAAELTDIQARAGQCRACRTMGGQDVRCDACADSGMIAEVARLRDDAAGWKALAGRRRVTGRKMLTELEQMLPVIKALEEKAKTARRAALLEAAEVCDQYPASGTDAAEDIRALVGLKP